MRFIFDGTDTYCDACDYDKELSDENKFVVNDLHFYFCDDCIEYKDEFTEVMTNSTLYGKDVEHLVSLLTNNYRICEFCMGVVGCKKIHTFVKTNEYEMYLCEECMELSKSLDGFVELFKKNAVYDKNRFINSIIMEYFNFHESVGI